MTSVWDFFKNLFREAEESSSYKPLVHESIQRTEDEKEALRQWAESLTCRRIRDWLSDQYAIWQVLPDDTDHSIDFLNTPSSKGFAIHLEQTSYEKQTAVFLFDYLRERVLTLNYKSQMSDTRTWVEKKHLQTVDRHYLKPRPNWASEEKLNQQFGNITIELSLRNDIPRLLTFRATSYSDRLYSTPEDFKDLMQAILS